MAKIVHHNIVDTVNDMLIQAKERGIIHLSLDGDEWKGNRLQIDDKSLVNFGTCGYLGLEIHPLITEYVQTYTKQYGAQFSVSRAYLTSKPNRHLEELLMSIYDDHKVIVFSSTTLAHIAIIPIIVESNDLIIVDQQAHVSIQNAAQLMVGKGVPIEMIRHSNLEMLEEKIKAARTKHKRIWYMIDGVYSMYGDIAPIEEINLLMEKYEQLHLYVDDAHGMSWYGNHGCGRVFESTRSNGRTIYMSTLAKGFGCMGGTVIFPSDFWYEKVILHGGPLAYSHPIPPPMMGAAIASAEIHLSPEIVELQKELKHKLDFADQILKTTQLPILSNSETPIFFVGTGQPNVGYSLNRQVLDDGYYVNIGMFPAVPVKNTGLRFTITNHNSLEEIEGLIRSIEKHYEPVLESEGKTMNAVRKAFRLPLIEEKNLKIFDLNHDLNIQLENTIINIPQEEWDACFADKGNFDWLTLKIMEEAFSNNIKPEENWKFHYLVIRNIKNEIVCACYCTEGIFKDDLVSPVHVSACAEEQRLNDPYYLCSKLLILGSLFTEGEHLYIDRTNLKWKSALRLILESLQDIQDKNNLNGIILRDFHNLDKELEDIFHTTGYFKVRMPNSNIIDDLQKEKEKDYIELLSPKSRRNVRLEVIKNEDKFDFEVHHSLSKEKMELFYSMYEKVSEKNLAINIFNYPKQLFYGLNGCENWEFLELTNKANGKTMAIICAYKSKSSYFPILIGMDYEENEELYTYKQMLYRTALYARNKGFKNLHFGLTADYEKRKLGAKQIESTAFMSIKDQYHLELIDKMGA